MLRDRDTNISTQLKRINYKAKQGQPASDNRH
jgi:hypothetical protein